MKKGSFPIRHRGWFQALATLLTNGHVANFFSGKIYQGKGKLVCVPGLNCYSCPGAAGACPIGAYQAVIGSSKYKISYYVIGLLIFLGVMAGRFICGWLCPFGWFQELCHKIPSKKFSTKKVAPLRWLKYVILVVVVGMLPFLITNSLGMGNPFFCKYICPEGVLGGALPLAAVNPSIRAALGSLFTFKAGILALVILLSVFLHRPFCKWICPLGAFYSLFNKVSFYQYKVDQHRCVHCGRCARVCPMDVDITKTPASLECIRCGVCIKNCPTDAISTSVGRCMANKSKKCASCSSAVSEAHQTKKENTSTMKNTGKLMTKTLALALSALVVLQLAGCGTKKPMDDPKKMDASAQSMDQPIATSEGEEPMAIAVDANGVPEGGSVSIVKEMAEESKADDQADKKMEAGDVEKFPSFKAKDFDGKDYDNTVFEKADATVLNFWFTGCKACVDEMPDLEKLSKELKEKNVQIMTVCTDATLSFPETIEMAKKIMKEAGVTFPTLSLDENSDAGNYICEMTVFPSSLVINAKGEVMGRIDGALVDKVDQLNELIEKAKESNK